jgi:hypothetical protein
MNSGYRDKACWRVNGRRARLSVSAHALPVFRALDANMRLELGKRGHVSRYAPQAAAYRAFHLITKSSCTG